MFEFVKKKTCIKCHKNKKLEEFPQRRGRKDGKQNWCLECNRIKQEKIRRKYRIRPWKEVYGHDRPKALIRRFQPGGAERYNEWRRKERARKNGKAYISPEDKKEKGKSRVIFIIKNCILCGIEYQKPILGNWRYCERCRKGKEKINFIFRERYKKEPKFRLNTIMRKSISESLHGTKNGKRWQTLVGYTINDLKNHIESQFTGEMNWENQGSYWHIDHIIPISAFNFSDSKQIDFKRCWALNNLRPFIAKDNLRKGNNINGQFQPSLSI
jgi:hypothetical protein